MDAGAGRAHYDSATNRTTIQLTNRTPIMSTDRLLTLAEAATLAGCSNEALRQRIRRGKLHAVKGNDGRLRVRLTDADIEALRAGRPFLRPADQPTERPTEQPAEHIAVVKVLEDHVQTLRERAEQDRVERERLLIEFGEERRRGQDLVAQLADRDRQLGQMQADYRAEVEQLRADHQAELERLQQVIDRLTAPWWRRWFGG